MLSCIFTSWCANFHGTGNPVLLAKLPAGLKDGRRVEPTEEQRDLINAHPEGCGFWAWLFEYTGLRMGEANGLQWKDVDLDAGKMVRSSTLVKAIMLLQKTKMCRKNSCPRSFDLPFVPRRHGTLRLRLKGRGQITLRSIAKTMAAAKGGIAGGEV